MSHEEPAYEAVVDECRRIESELESLHALLDRKRDELNRVAKAFGKSPIPASGGTAERITVITAKSGKRRLTRAG